ncbi:MAG: lamin tail domain-containing protein, partial [Candidatus Poribacteria bacterium]|nr:lamin tail domain-containing protein [Candidatus Poribacteria bacterium]
MLFNKLKFILVFAVLLIAGLAFVAIPATEAVTPVLSVPDEVADDEIDPIDENTVGIQRYGIRAESVSFPLTITFQKEPGTNNPVNTAVTGFDATDIVLQALDSNDIQVLNGATAASLTSTDNAVWTTTITVKGNVSKVNIAVPANSAQTLPVFSGGFQPGVPVPAAPVIESVEIIRSAAPPLTISPDRSIGGNTTFTVTLTSSTAITLTEADIKITDGSIVSLTSDAAKRVWTVTIRPGVAITQITVEPSTNGSYIFPKGTFTVDTTGPVATITPIPVGGGVYSATITFDEPLQTGAALLASELTVIGASIGVLSPIPATNGYVATLIPDPGATTVTVQIKAGAVADAGGVANIATPSPAHTFRVAATGTPTGGTPRQGTVTISEIMFATDAGTDEIQWIELSNTSKTAAVALDAGTGWKLIIENYDNPRANNEPQSGTINFKNSGRVKSIEKRQSVLIVSANGRNSATTHAKGQLFGATRVFKVYPALAAQFGMSSPRDAFLHPTQGFHIKLVDGSNNLVDEVGNLDGSVRTSDRPTWELPNGW